MLPSLQEQSLEYHSQHPSGKLGISVTKPASTPQDLSLAYSPGVAEPCLAIHDNPDLAYTYTWKQNTVAVVSDGSAVLGLGNIGGLAGLPVMEGKALLLKQFADIDGVPIVLASSGADDSPVDIPGIVDTVRRISPTFGAINLEDIKAPECVTVEDSLQDTGIPVFHDDQHGTAIVLAASVSNALSLTSRDIASTRFVLSGAGAAGFRIYETLISLGANPDTFFVTDSRGVIFSGRTEGMNPLKEQMTTDTPLRTLEEVLSGADVFIGVSSGGLVTQAMIRSMADRPLVFALANPTPEISPEDALLAGAFIVGTGRSDFPNQVNNVLAFPGIFRGALDVQAHTITPSMRLAATRALIDISREPFSDSLSSLLCSLYPSSSSYLRPGDSLSPSLVIPKPFDPRVVPRVARFVAKQALDDGVAHISIDNFDTYEQELLQRLAR